LIAGRRSPAGAVVRYSGILRTVPERYLIADVVQCPVDEERVYFLTTVDHTNWAQKIPETYAFKVKTWLERPKAATGELLSVDGHSGAQAGSAAKLDMGCDVSRAGNTGGVTRRYGSVLIRLVTGLGRGAVHVGAGRHHHEREYSTIAYFRTDPPIARTRNALGWSGATQQRLVHENS